jgi:hypothetical protein
MSDSCRDFAGPFPFATATFFAAMGMQPRDIDRFRHSTGVRRERESGRRD